MTDGVVGFKFSSMVPAFLAVLLVAVLIIVGFTAGAVLSNGSGSSSSLANPKTINVTGTATHKVAPNLVEVVLSVETLDASAQISQSSNATISDKVSAALKSAGVTANHISTVSYTVNEEFQYNDVLKKSVSVGYRTTNQVKAILTDLKTTGAVLDAAAKAGANRIDSVYFYLNPVNEFRERRAVLEEASGQARLKANSIAKGIGVSVGSVHSLTENVNYYPSSMSNIALGVMAKDSVATPISPSTVEVTANVSAEFDIK
ncbi:Uncharacterised protein [uncultured archaeon]|nr:Uncharacterised protein [uncultured archaeon]